MAGGSWYGSPTPSHTMIVTNTPSPDLALTNIAYCSYSDLNKFNVPKTKLYLASVADNSSVLSISAHERITEGHIALNGIQRRNAKVSTGDTVVLTRFVPADDFNLALLTLELAFVSKNVNRSEQIDAVLLAQQLRKRFVNQIMTVGQKVPFEYLGTNFVFTVSQAAVEGQEKSNTLERGMISADIYIVFEASKASGIKIVNQREAASSHIFWHKEFNLESLGIGGLSAEFADIFRRACICISCFSFPCD